jgi:C-terminal processing protease CtpA/Prc
MMCPPPCVRACPLLQEGTQEVLRYLVGQVQDEYSRYLTPQELRAQFRPQVRSSWQGEDKEEASGASLSASVGMAVEAAPYCPSSQPVYNPETATYDFPYGSRADHPQEYGRPCAVVTGVLPGSPAEQAGLKIGDRVAKIG